jgi:F-type H+/Na+-transporting ATPase subunit alpha
MPVEDQVAQVYAATNGYLDRIDVDRVERFLTDLIESLRGSESDLLKQIAGGDWSDEIQKQLDQAVSQFAEDFGYDLDEEGHPLEDGDEPSPSRQTESRGDDEGDAGETGGAGDRARDSVEETAGATA